MTDIMEGVRILEVAEHTFVPAASAVLSDWGADVIKIEHVERGDAMRGLASSGTVTLGGDVHVLLEHSNRRKRSLGLDLTTDEGLDILYRLAATCDVFLTNKTPSVRRKLRIDLDEIRAHNPSIIYVSGTAYGPRGPDADTGGYDMTGFWCRGASAETVRPADYEHFVSQPGPAYGDSLGGMTIAGGISAALFRRERTGHAAVVDVSLLGTGIWALGATVALTAQTGAVWAVPGGSGAVARGNPLVGTFTTGDDRFLNITVLQPWKYWPSFCETVGRPELLDDDRFSSYEALAEHSEAAHEIVRDMIASRTLEECKELLAGWDGQWTPVQNTLDLLSDPQVRANEYIVDLEADGSAYSLVTTPVQFDGEAPRPGKAPDFNEHGDAILTEELGIAWDDVVELKVKGVVA